MAARVFNRELDEKDKAIIHDILVDSAERAKFDDVTFHNYSVRPVKKSTIPAWRIANAYIMDSKPIASLYGTFFKQHNVSTNRPAAMVSYLMDTRKIEKIDPDIDEEFAYFMFMKSQYLHSKEWDTKRRTCLILHKYRCARCNCDNESLEVHHTSGYNLIPHEPQKVLVALCRNCHEIQHKKYGFPSTYKEYMEWNAPLV